MAIAFLGSAEGSAINGGTITLTYSASAVGAGTCAVVAYAYPSTGTTMNVTSSSTSTGYTQIVTTLTTTNFSFSVWRRILPANESQAICHATALASDGVTAVALLFSGVYGSSPESVTPTSTTGSGATPDSPSITVGSANNIVISAVAQRATDTTVTAPSSFLNQTDINANDTLDTTTGIAWIALTSSGAFNPGSWTNFTAAVPWAAASIALKPALPEWVGLEGFPNLPDYIRYDVAEY